MRARADRGAYDGLRFQVCARGFLITAGGDGGYLGTLFAFDRIEDVAAWLVDEYAHAHEPQDGKPECPDDYRKEALA